MRTGARDLTQRAEVTFELLAHDLIVKNTSDYRSNLADVSCLSTGGSHAQTSSCLSREERENLGLLLQSFLPSSFGIRVRADAILG
jgi:hypothetical protein